MKDPREMDRVLGVRVSIPTPQARMQKKGQHTYPADFRGLDGRRVEDVGFYVWTLNPKPDTLNLHGVRFRVPCSTELLLASTFAPSFRGPISSNVNHPEPHLKRQTLLP